RFRPEDHTKILARLIDNGWQYKFLENFTLPYNTNGLADCYIAYESALTEYLSEIKSLVNAKGSEDYATFLKSEVKKEFSNEESSQILDVIYNNWSDLDYLKENFATVIKNVICHNGTKLKSLKDTAVEVQVKLADLLFYHVYLSEWIELKKFWENLLEEYNKRKYASSRLTYSDISNFTYSNMHDKEISIIDPATGSVINRFYEFLSYKTRFMLIDEFQDTSVSQFKVFQPMISEILSGEGTNSYGEVIIVGDEKQAIYQWRSGERDLILKLKNIYPIQQSKLDTCFRSSNAVMEFINKLFMSEELRNFINESKFEWLYDEVKCAREKDQGEVKLYDFEINKDDEETSAADIYPDFVNRCLLPNLPRKDGKPDCGKSAVIARTNRELTEIANVLTQQGIPFVQESNNSLFRHDAIKPFFFLMDYIIYHDRLSLLKFYRSNLYLMSAKDMKVYLQKCKSLEAEDKFEEYLNTLPGIDKIRSLNTWYDNPLQFIIKTMELFNFVGIFNTENERKNLNKLLDVVSNFNHDRHEYSRNIAGFILYCQQLEAEENHTQETALSDDALTLISIHKSKGLDYKNVFAFNILGSGGNNSTSLLMDYRFDDKYQKLEEFHISLRCREILKLTTQSDVIKRIEQTELMQELNAIYVALTRAKDNLYLYYALKKNSDGSIPKGNEVNEVIYLKSKSIVETITNGIVKPKEHELERDKESFSDKDYHEFFLTDHSGLIKELPQEDRDNAQALSALYLDSRKNVIGSIVHHYLSYIPYDEPQYHENALRQTISRFGNLLPLEKIREYIHSAIEFTKTRKELFSREWVKVFNEYTIFDPNTAKEYRIDRLQIKDDLILIVDYKTGRITDKEQLERYKTIIAGLDYVKKGNYRIETEYISLKLTGVSEE
ncbi:MAG: UvrD-helicase domain-containing protein, partial [Candidatus Cloacimonetes bacterium]|nr:UvrD-helicase domain-containing protein [Candidatus Cloacimonadota bacterium]